jgi:8-oxo-dGTP pyrophosphatase MutT (NUDIX family)
VRETWEETGLMLAQAAPVRPGVGPWREFLAQGALADLAPLQVVARAVTPPMIAKRFDAWFLLAPAERLLSLEPQSGCGELDEIAWVSLDEALDLPLPHITRLLLTDVFEDLDAPDRPRPYVRHHAGAMRRFSL